MKAKLLGIFVALMTALSTVAFADTPTTMQQEIVPNMETEDFEPLVFLHQDGCTVYLNYADDHYEAQQRIENYAFEGEQIVCPILVVDKNGVPDKIRDVFATVAEDQEPTPSDIEVNCEYLGPVCHLGYEPEWDFNARIDQEVLSCEDDPDTLNDIAGVYRCTLTVESPYSHQGEYWISMVAEDVDGLVGWADEQEFWFLNPEISLLVIGDVDFGVVRPGTISYASTVTVMNDAEEGSGVLLDMFISGRDFTDPYNSGAKCPTSNVLLLRDSTGGTSHNFGYYASNGAYHTIPGCVNDGEGFNRQVTWFGGVDEGYYDIPYETGDEAARQEIIECAGAINLGGSVYEAGNVLSPGAEMSVTFALALPEPCNGDFTDGSFYLWAEAI